MNDPNDSDPKNTVRGRCPGPGWDDYAAADTHPVPSFLLEDHYKYLGSEPIAASRYTSVEFFQRELEKMWPQVAGAAKANAQVQRARRDGRFARTGETLWPVRLNAVPNSFPVTYSIDGKQFVAIVSGGGGFHDVGSGEITPEIENSAASTTLWVFALP